MAQFRLCILIIISLNLFFQVIAQENRTESAETREESTNSITLAPVGETILSTSCTLFGEGIDVAPGIDIAKAPGKTPAHCCPICGKTPGCRAWSWNKAGPMCYLKNLTYTAQARDKTTRSGLVGDTIRCTFHKGYDITPGRFFAVYITENPGECCGICSGEAECKGWSYSSESKRCYLKDDETLIAANEKTTVAGLRGNRYDMDQWEHLIGNPLDFNPLMPF